MAARKIPQRRLKRSSEKSSDFPDSDESSHSASSVSLLSEKTSSSLLTFSSAESSPRDVKSKCVTRAGEWRDVRIDFQSGHIEFGRGSASDQADMREGQGKGREEEGGAVIDTVDGFAAYLTNSIMSDVRAALVQRRRVKFCSYNRPISTGNWGCGAHKGDPQLKLVLQWVASSLTGAPSLIYYTFHDPHMSQAEELVTAVLRAGWTVGTLMTAVKLYCDEAVAQLEGQDQGDQCLRLSLFDFLLDRLGFEAFSSS